MHYKYTVAVALLIASTALLYGQERKDTVPTKDRPEKTTITGELKLVQGAIALEKEGLTYFISGLKNVIGFVEGLKEGATVTLEGYAIPTIRQKTTVLFRTTKLTIGDKDYDLSSPSLGNGQMMLLWNNLPEPRLGADRSKNDKDRQLRYGQRNQQRQHPKQERRRYQDHRQRPSVSRCF